MNKRNLTACIIDDDEVYVYAIKRLISIQNLCDNVLVFYEGRAAINYMATNKHDISLLPDLILIDVNMPVLDGWGFIEEFQKLGMDKLKPADLYMVSSSIDPKDVQRAKKFSIIKKYIFKPITFEELNEVFSIEDVNQDN